MKRKNHIHQLQHTIEATPITDDSSCPTKNLPKGAEFILKDENSTSYEFQLYNFVMGILFLAFGLNLISGTMMLVNLAIAFVHLDLGFASYDVTQLWHRVQVVMGLCVLVFVYIGLLHNAGESILAEGFTGPGIFLLVGVVGAETHLWDICSKATSTGQETRKASA